jgi:hypothetical protein
VAASSTPSAIVFLSSEWAISTIVQQINHRQRDAARWHRTASLYAGCYLRFVARFVARLVVGFVVRFVDFLAVVFGFDLTVLFFTERPPIAARPRVPDLGFAFTGTNSSSSVGGTRTGSTHQAPSGLTSNPGSCWPRRRTERHAQRRPLASSQVRARRGRGPARFLGCREKRLRRQFDCGIGQCHLADAQRYALRWGVASGVPQRG